MKILLLLFTLLLAISLAACGGTTDAPGGGGGTAPAAGTGDGGGDTTTPAGPRTVTITLTNSGAASWIDNWNITNDWQYIYNNLGITMEARILDEEQFGIMLAGGDLTDIVAPRQRFIPAIMQSNLAMNLYPLIDDHLPMLRSTLFAPSVELSRMFMGGPDNHLYFLASMIGPEGANIGDMQGRGYVVRWDLYEAIGMPEINSDDDFIEVLLAMREIFPETPDGRPVFGMGLNSTFQPWHQRGAFIREGTTGNFWTFNGFLYMASFETMELINGYTNLDSPHWVDMRFFNRMYNLGLLDPDSFTQTSGEAGEKMNAQQYLSQVARDNGLFNHMLQQEEAIGGGPNTRAGMVMIPSRNAIMGGNKLSPAGGMPTDSIFVFSRTQNWEAALEVLNTYREYEFLRMLWNGIRGDTWDYDEDGRPFLTERGIAARLAAPLGSEANRNDTGIAGSMWDWTPVNPTAIHPDGFFFAIDQEFEYRAMLLNPLYRHVAEVWGVPTTSMYYQRLIDEGFTLDWRYDYAQVVAMGLTDIPSDILRIMNNVNEITIRSIPGLVRASTMEEFYALQQAYLAEIAAEGEDRAWEWALNAYNEAHAIASPIFWEARRNTDAILAARRD